LKYRIDTKIVCSVPANSNITNGTTFINIINFLDFDDTVKYEIYQKKNVPVDALIMSNTISEP
jgi:hypothetical protein